MRKNDELRYRVPGESFCVDMQRMFAEAPNGRRRGCHGFFQNSRHRSVTRGTDPLYPLHPANAPGRAGGIRCHCDKPWSSIPIERLGPEMIELVPDLARFVPPARTLDKDDYSPWTRTDLRNAIA
jgi:hypothetical protein